MSLHLSNVSEHPIHFLISLYLFIISTSPTLLYSNLWSKSQMMTKGWLILTHCSGFQHLPIIGEHQGGSNGSSLCLNGDSDISTLVDSWLHTSSLLAIHPRAWSGGDAFWHAKSSTHHSSASLRKIFSKHLDAYMPWNVVPRPNLHWETPQHPSNKAKDLNITRPRRQKHPAAFSSQ